MSFGKRLKELREENNLSRDELAEVLKLTYSAVSKYETDKRFPDQDTLSLIADYFSISTDYLLGRTDTVSSQKSSLVFGERLKALREEKGLTQNDIAKVLCVGRATIAGYETKGKQPDYEKLLQLSDFLGVTTDYLLGRTDEKKYISKSEEYEIMSDAMDEFKRKLIDEGILKDKQTIEKDMVDAITRYGESAAIEILKHRKKQDS